MTPFTIAQNNYLTRDVKGFFHTAFGGVDLPSNPNFLYKLKNDPKHQWPDDWLNQAQHELMRILMVDLPQILKDVEEDFLTVCVVPRAKADVTYRPNQLLFKRTVKNAVEALTDSFQDGTDFIIRHTDTKTTHRRKPDGFANDGPLPYPRISLETCSFSREIRNQNILLIDDIYTKTVNIDEDMIQALFTRGARSVVFYAIGNTISSR